MSTITDVAREAGVSVATVSRAAAALRFVCRSADTTTATAPTTIAPPTRIAHVTDSERISQPRKTATTGFTYA